MLVISVPVIRIAIYIKFYTVKKFVVNFTTNFTTLLTILHSDIHCSDDLHYIVVNVTTQ